MPEPAKVSTKPRVDISGKTFGRWRVIRYLGNRKWLCECTCGTHAQKSLDGRVLRRGLSKSCGCLKKESDVEVGRKSGRVNVWRMIASNVRYSKDEYGRRVIFKYYRNNSRSRGTEFALTFEVFSDLIQSECHYCGDAPNTRYVLVRKRKTRTTTTDITYNGLDRIDPSRGYINDNVVPCCQRCNYLKRNLTVDSFMQWVNRIYHRMVDPRVICGTVPGSQMESLYRTIAGKAKSRGLDFDIDLAAFGVLVTSCCHYCGDPPSNTFSKSRVNPPMLYNGLDRVDNNKGYCVGNVVPCCAHCNRAKNNSTLIEFYDQVSKIHGWLNRSRA